MEFLGSKKFLAIIGFLGLYLLSTGTSWAIFSFVKGSPAIDTANLGELQSARSRINLDLPRTETCPINGGKFTKIERNIWEGRRPLTVSIENHADSRPPSGLSRADVVYEAVAEGGITRFLGVFHCGVAAEDVQIAPVRSARIYFVNLAAGYGDRPIFAHVGGANAICGNCSSGVKPVSQVAREVRAIEELASLGWRIPRGNDFDTTYDSGFPVFWRNYERLGREVASEHTMMISSDKIFEEAAKRGFTDKKDGKPWDRSFNPWNFKEDAPADEPKAANISFEFWSNKPEYNVEWKYDKGSNAYLRSNGGKPHADLEYNNKQLSAKNVVIMFVVERGPVDSEKHMYYEVEGTGRALVFQDGGVIEGTWEKKSQSSLTRFLDSKGKEISFVGGTTWVEAVPKGNEINYD